MAEQRILTADDVAHLLESGDVDSRRALADKIGAQFADSGLTDAERAIIEDILRLMIRDAEAAVRAALAQSIRENPNVPHDVARVLAEDVINVAEPILSSSPVLTDDDLIRIVGDKTTAHKIAIARRPEVSSELSDVLAETRDADVAAALVANDGAKITERTFSRIVDEFGADPKVNQPMAERTELPLVIAERLVTLVSESVRETLVTRHRLTEDTASDLVLQTREQAMLALIRPMGRNRDLGALVEELHAHGRLTPSLVVRALCLGDMAFFETAMGKLGGISAANAYRLINDRGPRGLGALYDKAGLPDGLYPIVRAAVDVAHGMDYDGRDRDRERYRQRMLERILTQFEDGFDAEHFDYLLGKLASTAASKNVSPRAH